MCGFVRSRRSKRDSILDVLFLGPRMRISFVFDFSVDFAQTALNKVLGATVEFNGFWELSQNLNLKGMVDFKRETGYAASSGRRRSEDRGGRPASLYHQLPITRL